MKRSVLIILLVIIGTLAIYFFKIFPSESNLIVIGNAKIEIETAKTQEQRIRGLSGRESLPQNRGLLFIYEIPAFYEIWMKDMKFPIDIIWIDEKGEIIDIKKDAKPESFPETFKPSAPAKYILEVNAGFSSQTGFKIGDDVIFDF